MTQLPDGYWQAVVPNTPPGSRYRYQVDNGNPLPDPASRWQPDGVHGPSAVPQAGYPWTDQAWRGLPLDRYVIYELHVGTFTQGGSFTDVIPQLDYLRDLGVTAVELLPVAQFPGGRNWGYDGVYPYAAQSTYGGPEGLARLVDACHERGLSAVLDVVYNHLGPEGNYLGQYGPYFTNKYGTPWGQAINYDGPASDGVRNYFIQNALYWLRDLHFDALRLDAVHAIYDFSANPFLREMGCAVQELSEQVGRPLYLIAESDLNDTRLLRTHETGGYGLHAQWMDDFHHAVHAYLTKEDGGYYSDFGSLDQIARALSDGFVYDGQYSAHRERRFGEPSHNLASGRFVVCTQNHDQVGNRAVGDRLSTLLSVEGQKVAAGLLLLSPFLPLLFMGQEYGEPAPFQYFVSHGDPRLVEGVRKGRAAEFAGFMAGREPPDPQSEETFHRSRLQHHLRDQEPHRQLLELHRTLLHLRANVPALANLSQHALNVRSFPEQGMLTMHRWQGEDQAWVAFNLSQQAQSLHMTPPAGDWRKVLDSADARWLGPSAGAPDRLTAEGPVTLQLPPQSFALYRSAARGDGL